MPRFRVVPSCWCHTEVLPGQLAWTPGDNMSSMAIEEHGELHSAILSQNNFVVAYTSVCCEYYIKFQPLTLCRSQSVTTMSINIRTLGRCTRCCVIGMPEQDVDKEWCISRGILRQFTFGILSIYHYPCVGSLHRHINIVHTVPFWFWLYVGMQQDYGTVKISLQRHESRNPVMPKAGWSSVLA